MTNSTEVYWDVDGVSLQTLAFNIETLGGDRMAPPPVRGDDILIPAAPGRRWMPKMPDSRTLSLGMWVIGAEETGLVPSDGEVRRQFEDNWRKLRNLLWVYDRELTITKRFYVDGVLKTASAKGHFTGGLNPSMNGQQRAVFTVDITLSDPYFYGPLKTEPLSASEVVTVEGDDVTRRIFLEVEGSRNNLIVRNATLDVQVEYASTLDLGDVLNIDVQKFTSVTDPDGSPAFKSVGYIRHEGSPSWLVLKPGDNTITVASDSGSGLVTMQWQEVWF